MAPFFNVGTLYEGPAAAALGGADIAFFVGLPVAGLLYYAFTRSVNVPAETRIAAAEAAAPGAFNRPATVRAAQTSGLGPPGGRDDCWPGRGQRPGAATRRCSKGKAPRPSSR